MVMRRRRGWVVWVVLVALVAAAVVAAGNYHFVYGSAQPLTAIKKVSWSLGETVVNRDEVDGLPPQEAARRYPLLRQALRH